MDTPTKRRRQRGARIVEQLLKTQARARAMYAKADQVLERLLKVLDVGDEVKLGDGRVATLVDQFAHRNVCWRSSSFPRFKVEVETRV